MPGIEARAPDRIDTSSGLAASPKCLPTRLAHGGQRRIDLGRQAVRVGAAGCREDGADFGGDGEAGRNRQAEIGHFGQVGALAAEQGLHVGTPFG